MLPVPAPLIPSEDPPPPDYGWREYAAWTVAIAAASTLASSLAEWAVDELRARYGSQEAARIRVAGDDDAKGPVLR